MQHNSALRQQQAAAVLTLGQLSNVSPCPGAAGQRLSSDFVWADQCSQEQHLFSAAQLCIAAPVTSMLTPLASCTFGLASAAFT